MFLRSYSWQLVSAALLSIILSGPVIGQINTISDAESQTGYGGINSIIGTVFDPSGRPLQRRVPIRLSTMTRGDRVHTTGENGQFAFRGLPSGSYTISIDKEKEYKPFSISVDIVQIGRDPVIQTLNIPLKYQPGATKPATVNVAFLNVPEKALKLYNDAVEQSKKGDSAAAVDQLKLAIAEHPSFTMAYNELGVQYLKLNRLEEADQAFQSALKLDPELLAGLINRGIANVMMKRYGEAVPVLRKALTKDEQSAVGHYFLGQALANLGLFDEAEKELVVSLKLGKEQMKEAHRILAIIYSSRGDKKKAAEELEGYLKVSPDTPDAEQLKEMIKRLKESQ